MLPEIFAAWLLKDDVFFNRVSQCLVGFKKFHLFDEDKVVAFVVDAAINHYNKYSQRPSFEVLDNEALNVTGVDHREIWAFLNTVKQQAIAEVDREWALDTAEKWLKRLAFIKSIENAHAMLVENKDNYASALPDIEEALGLQFQKDLGHVLLSDWRERVAKYNSEEEKIPFFLPFLNAATNGGMRKASLNVFTSRTGGGKTLFMVNQAVDMLSRGLNVLYITMEDGEVSIGKRMDAIITGIPLVNLEKDRFSVDQYERRIQAWAKRHGDGSEVVIRQFESGSPSVLSFKTLLKDLQIQKGFKPDVIFVDYLNLMASTRASRAAGTYAYVGAIAVELRGLAQFLNIPIITATQLTRDGARNDDPTAEDVSESINISNTADFMLAVTSDKNMRQSKQSIVKIIKSRYGGEQTVQMVESDPERGVVREFGAHEDVQPVATQRPAAERKQTIEKTAGGGLKAGTPSAKSEPRQSATEKKTSLGDAAANRGVLMDLI